MWKLASCVVLVACGRVNPVMMQGDDAPLPIPDVAFTVTNAGLGIGTITSDPAGIDCGSACTAQFPSGTIVTLSTVTTGSTIFMGWTGACSGTGPCVTTLTSAQAVTAMFGCTTGTMTFNFTGVVETLALPCKSFSVDASGAQGGFPSATPGGLGARIQGTFALSGGSLNVIVGGKGSFVANGNGGGGGASYVYVNANDAAPLLVAAGGGGQSSNSSPLCTPGPGSATQTPTDSANQTMNGVGGTGGNGGSAGVNVGSPVNTGGGGAGWLSDGATGTGPGGNGGSAPRNGGAGGPIVMGQAVGYQGAAGGFGGGGGSVWASGSSGGGGGYNGGGGGHSWNGSWGCGGGGGSFNAGTAATNTAGARTGDGTVTISW